MSKKKLIPVVGKRYVTRGGWITPPLDKHKCDAPIPGECEGVFEIAAGDDYVMFDGNGRTCMNTPGKVSQFDLIREYDEKVPQLPGNPVVEWKCGIPTREEIRDCWIINAGEGSQPSEKAVICKPGELSGLDVFSGMFSELLPPKWYMALHVKPLEEQKSPAFTVHEYCDMSGKSVWIYGNGEPVAGLMPTGKKRVVEFNK